MSARAAESAIIRVILGTFRARRENAVKVYRAIVAFLPRTDVYNAPAYWADFLVLHPCEPVVPSDNAQNLCLQAKRVFFVKLPVTIWSPLIVAGEVASL